ncbi:hypothetical protein TWF225_001359 [Orbilia oligospora]|uniref:Uncharacterized protein n=1 Tax=Orbilia oligospora TaxID=2813651 RepID=A0A7C8KGA3_ORBOL|nr:hypothetical protein TWF751_008897 [Orbilia oligospora]KAF3191201.1 hypothetical protein TWF225_001359 [Orbilia oligospora]KAF3238727.1 hypothetical protein TWF128_011975 [Orbilia oligospora]KAF3249643.1 hypothetical protein TWF217_008842 [Orbilia oligospora]TGJ66064.1 hypothetical protein EYR41_007724 [Orbilia oligospora]
MTNVSLFHDILSSTLKTNVPYQWPELCLSLPDKYEEQTDFRYFNVCTIYPDVLQGLSNGAFDSNRTFIDELSNYRIQAIQNVPTISIDITGQTVDFLARTCDRIGCNNDFSAQNNVRCDGSLMRSQNGQNLVLEEVNSCMAAICKNLEPYVKDDPDIGGVGVFISYILQILLVLMMTIYVLFKFILHERRVVPDDMHSPFDGSIAFPESLKEFQKLQSWFIGSLVIAAFIRQTQAITSISVTDFLFLGGISLNGVVLICYMNAALLLLGRKSWYVYILSCVTFFLCSAFLLYANWMRGVRIDNVLPALSFCRGQLSAAVESSNQITEWVILVSKVPRSTIYIAWGFCLLVQIACIFWMLEGEKKLSRGFRDWIATTIGQVFLWLFILAIVLCFLAIFALQVTMLYNFWGIVDPSQWSFGQIIAVTIWLPIIIDYIHGRFKEKQGYLANGGRYEKDEEAGYAVIMIDPAPGTGGSALTRGTGGSGGPGGSGGSGSSGATAVHVPQPHQGTFNSHDQAHSDSSSTVYSHPQRHSMLSNYSFPPPQIHIDTHGGPPTISPTIVTQSHFGSPLLPSIPSSPLFSMQGVPGPGTTPPGMTSLWNRGGVPHDSRTFAPTPLSQERSNIDHDQSSRARDSGTTEFTLSTRTFGI